MGHELLGNGVATKLKRKQKTFSWESYIEMVSTVPVFFGQSVDVHDKLTTLQRRAVLKITRHQHKHIVGVIARNVSCKSIAQLRIRHANR